MIHSMPQYNGEVNLPGYLDFKFVPLSYVQSVPDHWNQWSIYSDIVLLAGKEWLNGYATQGTLRVAEGATANSGLVTYLHRVEGFLPRDIPDLTGLMQAMAHDRFLVLAKNADQNRKLLGTLQTGLRFSYSYDSKRIGEQQVKGYSYRFEAQCLEPAPFYYATAPAAPVYYGVPWDNPKAQALVDGATISWNVALGRVGKVTLGGNRLLAFPTNLSPADTLVLYVQQDATGGRLLDFAPGYYIPEGLEYEPSADANALDVLTFVTYDGVTVELVAQKKFVVA